MIRSPGNPRIRMPKVEARATDTTPGPDGWHFNMDGGPPKPNGRGLTRSICGIASTSGGRERFGRSTL